MAILMARLDAGRIRGLGPDRRARSAGPAALGTKNKPFVAVLVLKAAPCAAVRRARSNAVKPEAAE